MLGETRSQRAACNNNKRSAITWYYIPEGVSGTVWKWSRNDCSLPGLYLCVSMWSYIVVLPIQPRPKTLICNPTVSTTSIIQHSHAHGSINWDYGQMISPVVELFILCVIDEGSRIIKLRANARRLHLGIQGQELNLPKRRYMCDVLVAVQERRWALPIDCVFVTT